MFARELKKAAKTGLPLSSRSHARLTLLFIAANTQSPMAVELSNNRLGRAIVLDSNGLIVGYVSLRDVSKARSEQDRR